MIVSNKCQVCKERFSTTYAPVGIFSECNHLHHLTEKCYTTHCAQCGETRGEPLHPSNFETFSQKNINYMSVVRKHVRFTWTDRFRGVYRLFKTIPIFIQLYWKLFTNSIDIGYLFFLNNYLVNLFDIRIKCYDQSKEKLLDSSYKRVIICNHTNYHDLLVVGSLTNPKNVFGFVASEIINTLSFGRAITKILPNVIIKDKDKTKEKSETSYSNYQVIKNYFQSYPEESKLMICPEGMLTQHKTICKFRSTAFKLGYPVQPIVLKYRQNVFDLINFDIWCFKKINVEVTVLDPIDTDGSEKSIESIRQTMAKVGGFYLSEVINE